MNRLIGFSIFILVFLGVYYGMHYYVFMRLTSLFGIRFSLWIHLIISALALSYPIAALLEHFTTNPLSRYLYILSASWLGVLFFLVSVTLIHDLVSLFIAIPPRFAGPAIITVVFLMSSFAVYNANSLSVRKIDLPVEGLKDPVSLVQLSDIHLGTIHKERFMSKVVDMTNDLEPDMVVITGDLVDGSGMLGNGGIKKIDDFKAKTFMVAGNHERYFGIDKVVNLLKDVNVTFLMDEVVTYKGIQVVGIKDPDQDFKKTNDVISTLTIDEKKPSVLLYHPPSGIKDANRAGIDLQLSGHTHDGQIFPFNLVVKMFYPFTNGLYDYNGTYLYVSPGTGTWGPPMRLGSRSEITYIRLMPA